MLGDQRLLSAAKHSGLRGQALLLVEGLENSVEERLDVPGRLMKQEQVNIWLSQQEQ